MIRKIRDYIKRLYKANIRKLVNYKETDLGITDGVDHPCSEKYSYAASRIIFFKRIRDFIRHRESVRIDENWLITYNVLFNKIKIIKDIKWVIFPPVHYNCRCTDII